LRRFALLSVALIVVASCGGGGASRDGDIVVSAGEESVFDLRPGDCLFPSEDLGDEVGELPAVPCIENHTHEVMKVWTVGDPAAFPSADEIESDVYPGEGELTTWADRACLSSFDDYVGVNYFDSDLFYTFLLPTLDGWADGDNEVSCFARTTGWTMAESVHCTSGLRVDLESDPRGDEDETDSEEPEPQPDSAYAVPPDEPCPTSGSTSSGS